jgi:hypothetical protein
MAPSPCPKRRGWPEWACDGWCGWFAPAIERPRDCGCGSPWLPTLTPESTGPSFLNRVRAGHGLLQHLARLGTVAAELHRGVVARQVDARSPHPHPATERKVSRAQAIGAQVAQLVGQVTERGAQVTSLSHPRPSGGGWRTALSIQGQAAGSALLRFGGLGLGRQRLQADGPARARWRAAEVAVADTDTSEALRRASAAAAESFSARAAPAAGRANRVAVACACGSGGAAPNVLAVCGAACTCGASGVMAASVDRCAESSSGRRVAAATVSTDGDTGAADEATACIGGVKSGGAAVLAPVGVALSGATAPWAGSGRKR